MTHEQYIEKFLEFYANLRFDRGFTVVALFFCSLLAIPLILLDKIDRRNEK